jgi:uncharacterized protein
VTVSIDVRDLLGHPGTSRNVRVSESVGGLATEVARVPEDQPVAADLLFESVVEGVLVSGPIEGTMVLVCARCLKPLESSFRVDVQELFAAGATAQDDEYPLAEGLVDLEPMIRDAVVLAMPFAPLCRPDCLGLCERCGGDRNVGECACPPRIDSRWAALVHLDLPDDRPSFSLDSRNDERS